MGGTLGSHCSDRHPKIYDSIVSDCLRPLIQLLLERNYQHLTMLNLMKYMKTQWEVRRLLLTIDYLV
ncbi:unnamed protein product [Allacma fusca]|uniref:Uncharacterized protein n=1 Tax=Allacma fusca TaxID=39272 RepID=A0A8J2LP43_9HEXA|nr:unnamed protein product [Allacma fusca]